MALASERGGAQPHNTVRVRCRMRDGHELYFGRFKVRVPGDWAELDVTPRVARALRSDVRVEVAAGEEGTRLVRADDLLDAPQRATRPRAARQGETAGERARERSGARSPASGDVTGAAGETTPEEAAHEDEGDTGAGGELPMTPPPEAPKKRPLFGRRPTKG